MGKMEIEESGESQEVSKNLLQQIESRKQSDLNLSCGSRMMESHFPFSTHIHTHVHRLLLTVYLCYCLSSIKSWSPGGHEVCFLLAL